MKKDGNFPVHSVDILFTLSLFFVFTVICIPHRTDRS